MNKATCDVSVSLDGFAVGPNQTAERPFGDGDVEQLHRWMFETPDENQAELSAMTEAGAYIMGRNMFGPIRGKWDTDWKGWWGDDPPFHAPVFVLTHHPRPVVEMEGGTDFTFVTDGIDSALQQARAAAGTKPVAISGGAATINQYLAAGAIDELRLHIVPIVLGAGERVFDGVPPLTLEPVSSRSTPLVQHLAYRIVK